MLNSTKLNRLENPLKSSELFNDFRVLWSEEDGEFVGVCSGHPYLSHLAKTEHDALAGIKELVEFVENEQRDSLF
jgi:hypothetical protein